MGLRDENRKVSDVGVERQRRLTRVLLVGAASPPWGSLAVLVSQSAHLALLRFSHLLDRHVLVRGTLELPAPELLPAAAAGWAPSEEVAERCWGRREGLGERFGLEEEGRRCGRGRGSGEGVGVDWEGEGRIGGCGDARIGEEGRTVAQRKSAMAQNDEKQGNAPLRSCAPSHSEARDPPPRSKRRRTPSPKHCLPSLVPLERRPRRRSTTRTGTPAATRFGLAPGAATGDRDWATSKVIPCRPCWRGSQSGRRTSWSNRWKSRSRRDPRTEGGCWVRAASWYRGAC